MGYHISEVLVVLARKHELLQLCLRGGSIPQVRSDKVNEQQVQVRSLLPVS
jgi:hypothetical protein